MSLMHQIAVGVGIAALGYLIGLAVGILHERARAARRDALAAPQPEPESKTPATIDAMFDRMNKAPRGVFYGHDPMTIWVEAWRAAEWHHNIKEQPQ